MLPSFNVTDEQRALIRKIAMRADAEIFKPAKSEQTIMATEMDLCAVIAQGTPLRLHDLLMADELNFTHDIAGIYTNINRDTGLLENHFTPRYFDSEAAKA